MADQIRLVHPDLPDQPIDVHPDAVTAWTEHGWHTEDSRKTPTAKQTKKEPSDG